MGGAVPKKRVMSFYEKHDPTKFNEVPTILSKYYGDYPQLVKKLERKYQDYGYFLGCEEDEAPFVLVREQLRDTYTLWINSYWNVYAPQQAKTAARNIRYNLTSCTRSSIRCFGRRSGLTLNRSWVFLKVPKSRNAKTGKKHESGERKLE